MISPQIKEKLLTCCLPFLQSKTTFVPIAMTLCPSFHSKCNTCNVFSLYWTVIQVDWVSKTTHTPLPGSWTWYFAMFPSLNIMTLSEHIHTLPLPGVSRRPVHPHFKRGAMSFLGAQLFAETWPLIITDRLFVWSWSVLCSPAVLLHIVSFSFADPHLPICPARQPLTCLLLPVPHYFAAVISLPVSDPESHSWIHLPASVWALAQAEENEQTGIRWPATCYQRYHILPMSQANLKYQCEAFMSLTNTILGHLRVCII